MPRHKQNTRSSNQNHTPSTIATSEPGRRTLSKAIDASPSSSPSSSRSPSPSPRSPRSGDDGAQEPERPTLDTLFGGPAVQAHRASKPGEHGRDHGYRRRKKKTKEDRIRRRDKNDRGEKDWQRERRQDRQRKEDSLAPIAEDDEAALDDRETAAPEDDGADDAGDPETIDVQGIRNSGTDCFLNASLQLLAGSYRGLLTADLDLTDDLRAWINRYGWGGANPHSIALLRGQLEAEDADLGHIAAQAQPQNPAPARAALERIKTNVYLHAQIRERVAAIMDAVNDPTAQIEPQAARELRGYLRQLSPPVVLGVVGHEDAQEVLSGLLSLLLRGQANRIGVSETWTVRDTEQPDGAAPDHIVQYDDNDQSTRAMAAETMLQVPIADHDGLVPYLCELFGDGYEQVVEHDDGSHEWANVRGQDVAVTRRHVVRRFTSLPAVLTIQLQRALPNGAKIDKAFEMPETITLIEHSGDDPVAKRYRLRSFVHHTGDNTFGGHYWAHTRRDGRWMRADDSRVTTDRQAQDAEAPVEREIEHDIHHGYIYTYELVAGAEPEMPEDFVEAEPLDRASLPAAPELPERGPEAQRRAQTRRPRPPAQPPATSAEPVDQGPHRITQCGFMTGDMFIICSALRLDRQLSVQVLWDKKYYLDRYQERCKAEGVSLEDLYNRERPSDPKPREAILEELGGRMERNARTIEKFYLDAGIATERITVKQAPGSARDEYKKIEKRVFPTDGGEPDPFERLPGFATLTVGRAFRDDLHAARCAVDGMFGGLSKERKAVIDKLREERAGDGPVALIWSRATYRKTSNGNPGLDTDPDVMADVIRLVGERCRGRTAFVVGDSVFDGSAALDRMVREHGLIEYWNSKELPGGPLSYLEQMYFLNQLYLKNQAIAIGMISGVIEIPALLGMPTFYFELSSMRDKGVRWSKMSGKGRPRGGAIPNLNQIELSGDMEHAARLRAGYADLRAWLQRAGDVRAGAALSAESTQKVIAAFAHAATPTGKSFRIDPDADPAGKQHAADMARVNAAIVELAAARGQGRPAALPARTIEVLDGQVRAALRAHAMTPEEQADLGALIGTWERIEQVGRDNANELAELDDEELVSRLQRMRPGATIENDGSSVVINGSLTLAIEDLRLRMMTDVRWILRRIDGQTERPLQADQPLALVAAPGPVLEKARATVDAKAAFDALGEILGPVHLAGLIQDLATLPGALQGVLASVDLPAARVAAALVGPAALAGVLTEFKTNPGKLRIFLEGILARRRELTPPKPFSLDGAQVLHSQLVMPAHRAALAGRDEGLRDIREHIETTGDQAPPEMRPTTRELDKRGRTPQEKSQAQLLQQEVDPGMPVLTSGLGYSRGNGRVLELGLEDDGDALDRPAEYEDVPDAVPVGVLPLDAADRRSPKYNAILAAIYDLRILGATRAGLAELADLFLSAFKTRSTPRFLTASSAILDALGLHAGLPMQLRDRRQTYASFVAKFADPDVIDGEAYAASSFLVELCGARLEVVPIDTLRMPGPDGESSLMRLAHSRPEFAGQRIYDGMEVAIAPHSDPDKVRRGHLHGYTETGQFKIELDGRVETISPDVYHVAIPDVTPPPQVGGVPVATVEDMFGRKEIGGKLRKLVQQLIAKDVQGIEHYTVTQYMDLIRKDGFVAYVVGGAVRDIVKGGKDPADVDLVTTMPAVDVASTFQRAGVADPQGKDGQPAMRTIGFRGITQVEHQAEDGLDVVSMHAHEPGTSALSLAEDVGNRDFTMNALFYDPVTEQVIDPTGYGLKDLQAGTLRWVCQVHHDGGDAAVRDKIRDGAYQAARWIKFRLRGLAPAKDTDADVVNEMIAWHLAHGITAEERAYFIDTMGVSVEAAAAKAEGIGLDPALLARLAPPLGAD